MAREVALEIAVQDTDGVRVAAQVGARRVELCAALGATGGLTPSIGLVEAAVAAAAEVAGGGVPVEVHPLVRPRPGGFVFSAAELDVQVRDVRAAVAAGASGVVIGALTPEGRVDADAVRALVAAAGGRDVTFHRAIDVVEDALAALDELAGLGVTRVLTSGGAPSSIDGVARLRAMATRAAGRVQIQAGGGVRPQDIAVLVGAGVDAVHLSAKRTLPDDGGPGGGGGAGYDVTDPEVARAARAAVDEALAGL
ncbi:copper homeostasis protein CutC [Oerskovia turbata]|uniref:PF03932 family protein CutC n=1 Tax=Oerskovia turbata TaxID=1713 RepID=A0A4Q1KT37_9CELL|nr:copper homeostasis protein CutC [Oerskovia turbata]RXR25645.1 copper homeostasis protein CutC [Oerskovia turbata]RXR33267.1 copper homeostasis protein CutC [Oerskovia turbata]